MAGNRARTSRARRNGDSALNRLVCAAVRYADARHTDTAVIASEVALDEAALAFASSLSAADRERLGR